MTGPKYLPFRADVVGSLLRPDAIHQARAKLAAGQITREDLWKIESGCVADAVALQKECD
jgi:5-methyltetrahydropteroyltriglutamate--homocysteine methyltransferase